MIIQRKGGGQSFGGSYSQGHISQFAYSPLRKLERIIVKLEPLSDQHGLTGFLCNIDNAKTLTSFVQELEYAITDYQVRPANVISGLQ